MIATKNKYEIGDKFNLLTIVGISEEKSSDGSKKRIVRCECGVEKLMDLSTLSRAKSCGDSVHHIKDITGQRFGRLVVTGLSEKRRPSNTKITYWHCTCDCGNKCIVGKSTLIENTTRSCSCLNTERITKHSLCKNDIYKIHEGIIQRCLNPNKTEYKNYGGRGIKVCERWKNSVAAFYEDMGDRPTPKHSIDRINVNGDYEPSNCRWATREEQQNNRRNNVNITFNGKTQTLTQWAKELSIAKSTLAYRVKNWSIQKAFSEKIK